MKTEEKFQEMGVGLVVKVVMAYRGELGGSRSHPDTQEKAHLGRRKYWDRGE